MLELDGKVDLVSNESFQLGVSSTLDPYNDCDEVWADDDLDIVYASGEGYGAWTKTEGFDITNEFEAVFLFAEERGAVAGRGHFSDVSGGAGACAGGYFNLENHWDDGYPFPLWVTTREDGLVVLNGVYFDGYQLSNTLSTFALFVVVNALPATQRADDDEAAANSSDARVCVFAGGVLDLDVRLAPGEYVTHRVERAGLAIEAHALLAPRDAEACPPSRPDAVAAAAATARVGSVEMGSMYYAAVYGDRRDPARYPVGFAIEEAYDIDDEQDARLGVGSVIGTLFVSLFCCCCVALACCRPRRETRPAFARPRRAGEGGDGGDEEGLRPGGGGRSLSEVISGAPRLAHARGRPLSDIEMTELPPLAEAQCVDNDLHVFAEGGPDAREPVEGVVAVAAVAAGGGGGSAPAAALAAPGGTETELGDIQLGAEENSEPGVVAQQVPSTRWREPVVAVELRTGPVVRQATSL